MSFDLWTIFENLNFLIKLNLIVILIIYFFHNRFVIILKLFYYFILNFTLMICYLINLYSYYHKKYLDYFY